MRALTDPTHNEHVLRIRVVTIRGAYKRHHPVHKAHLNGRKRSIIDSFFSLGFIDYILAFVQYADKMACRFVNISSDRKN